MFADTPPEDQPLYYPAALGVGFAIGALLGVMSTNPGHGAYLREVTLCGYVFGLITLTISGRWGCLAGVLLLALSGFNMVIPGFNAIDRTSQLGLILQIFLSMIWLRWRCLTLLRLLGAGLFTLALVAWPVLCDPYPLKAGIMPSITAWALAFGIFMAAQLALQVARFSRARRADSEASLPGIT